MMQRSSSPAHPFTQITPAQIAAVSPAEALALLESKPDGLTSEEAIERLHLVGPNQLRITPAAGGWLRTLALVVRPLLLPLWIAVGIEYSIGRPESALVLAMAAVLNTVVAAWQERKSERTGAALYDELPSFARVLRDGREQNILTSMIVPGDILLLEPNDLIPADARLLHAERLRTVNLLLAGDTPVQQKVIEPIDVDEPSTAEQPNIVYTGGRVTSGRGQAVVFATGLRTTYGRIAALTLQAHEEASPLMNAVARLGIGVTVLGSLGAVLGYFYATRGLGLSLDQGLGIAALFLVAAVPTGVLPGITLTLLEGARRLQRRRAIFRRLSSVETLGATTIICADKTGTLTQNQLTVQSVWTPQHQIEIGGVGYEPKGAFRSGKKKLDTATLAARVGPVLRAAAVTTTARLMPPNTLEPRWHVLGDPLEAALVVAATKAGIDVAEERAHRIDMIAPEDDTALKAALIEAQGGTRLVVHGPLDELLPRCHTVAVDGARRAITADDQRQLRQLQWRTQHDGGQVIVIAERLVSQHPSSATLQQADDLTLLGALAVLDPPRPEVAAAIRACHAAGIRTVMLTGDEVIGAVGVAQRCLLPSSKRSVVLRGAEVAAMDEQTLRRQLQSGDLVLAQLTPEQKVRVVEALEALGETVLVTGGAASDVPALKAANIGVAMAAAGSPAAGEAADLILLDDNFATIATAILEGRAVEQRVRRLVAFNLATTMVKLTALVASLVFGLPLLLTIGQQLLIDFLAGLLPGLAVGAGRPDPRLMARQPRRRPFPDRKVYWLGYGWFGALAAALALVAVLIHVIDDIPSATERAALFASSLRPYNDQIRDEIGQLGLTATSLYLVVSVAVLLGAGLRRRSVAPHDWFPQVLLFGLVGLSFAILIGLIVEPSFHPYIEVIDPPGWGWIAALGATTIMALLEAARQRIDPIITPQAMPQMRQALSALNALETLNAKR